MTKKTHNSLIYWGLVLISMTFLFVTKNERLTNNGASVFFLQFNSTLILLGLYIILFLITILFNVNKKIPKLSYLIFLLFITSVIPIIYKYDGSTYLGNLAVRMFMIFIFSIAYFIKVPDKKLTNIFVIMGVIMSLQVISTFFIVGIDYSSLDYKYYMVIPIAASNHIGLILIGLLIIGNYTIKNKILKLSFSVLLLVAIILTKSRSSFLILGLAITVMVFYYFKEQVAKEKWSKNAVYITVGITFSSVLILLIIFSGKLDTITLFFLGFAQGKESITLDDLFSGRLTLMKEGFITFLNYPIFGHGLYYKDNDLRMHNIISLIMYETGLFGLIVFTIIIIMIYMRINKVESYKMKTMFKVYFSILLIHSMIEPGIFTAPVDFIFWLMIALLFKQKNEIINLEMKGKNDEIGYI